MRAAVRSIFAAPPSLTLTPKGLRQLGRNHYVVVTGPREFGEDPLRPDPVILVCPMRLSELRCRQDDTLRLLIWSMASDEGSRAADRLQLSTGST